MPRGFLFLKIARWGVLHNARGWRTRPSEALPVPMKGISVSVAGMGDCKLG